MTSGGDGSGFIFPKWTNILRPTLAVLLVLVPAYVVVLLAYGASPQTTDVGYQPQQPVPYSHALHAGQLGIDCRYCHNTVERAAFAAVPPTQTCMNCHSKIRATSRKLLPIRESYATGLPVAWVKVHDLPDFVYFDHSAHVRRGVGCVECHGRVDTMEVVTQVERLSMGWCLDCHRAPARHLRPPALVTKMNWVAPEDPEVYGRRLMQRNNIHPSTQCWTCHR
jgi:hypothetical protein